MSKKSKAREYIDTGCWQGDPRRARARIQSRRAHDGEAATVIRTTLGRHDRLSAGRRRTLALTFKRGSQRPAPLRPAPARFPFICFDPGGRGQTCRAQRAGRRSEQASSISYGGRKECLGREVDSRCTPPAAAGSFRDRALVCAITRTASPEGHEAAGRVRRWRDYRKIHSRPVETTQHPSAQSLYGIPSVLAAGGLDAT